MAKPLPTIPDFGQQEATVKHNTDRVPDNKRYETKNDAICQPDNDTRQHGRAKDIAYLTGAFQLIDAHNLRHNSACGKNSGSETKIFNR